MKYSAFISYNHRDRDWARWLHRAIETFAMPKELVGRTGPSGAITRKFKPVFRDRDELPASSNLAQAVKNALAESESLIVLCSPHSVKSKWVNEEIRTFREMGRSDRIFCVIVGGEPQSDDPENQCMPPALFEEDGTEPLAADARPDQDGKQAARLKLIAAMQGLGYDDLRQREASRRIKRLSMIAAGATLGLVITSVLAVTAYLARNEAIFQRDIARQRTVTAERTVDFVTNMFQVADPSEARGRDITVREIVDRAAENYDKELADEPTVLAQIGLTLSEVYGALGLYRESDRLVGDVGQIEENSVIVRARQKMLAGESDYRLGEYRQSLLKFAESIELAKSDGGARETVLPRALAGLGQTLSTMDRFDDADRILKHALKLDEARGAAGRRNVAYDLYLLGLNSFFSGDYAAARGYLTRTNSILRSIEGELSPGLSDNINMLAAIAYFEGEPVEAERLYLSRLAIDEKVLGPDHPDVASTLNNIGRIRIERRAYAPAEQMLARAVDVAIDERGEQHDDMAFFLSNLALAREGTADTDAAESLFRRAMAVADQHGHRTRGPIRADLAALLCKDGQYPEGRQLIAEARPLVDQDYPGEEWRLALLDSITAECAWEAGERGEARQLFERSRSVLSEKWARNTHYGAALARRARKMGFAS